MLSSVEGLDPLFLAHSRLRRGRLDSCVALCDEMLGRRADEAAWILKCRALTAREWVDQLEVDDAPEAALDDAAIAAAPRPGTSLQSQSQQPQQPHQRPASTSGGRPLTGFARPGSRAGHTASAAAAPGTARPGTSAAPPATAVAGRRVRLGTQSMMASGPGGRLVQPERLDPRRWARRGGAAKALCDYLLVCEASPRLALQLAAEATAARGFEDWWWKARLGRCYYRMGMYRDAEQQLRSAMRQQPMLATALELAKVQRRLDQPLAALETLERGLAAFEGDPSLLLAQARLHDALGAVEQAVSCYRRVLAVDASSVEAVAQLAGHHFYADQPEVALRLYRRLLQMGVEGPEIYNNVGLASWYAGQYDLCLRSMERALSLADDQGMGDVYYNLAHVAAGVGDLRLAYQALRLAVSACPGHAEAFNNLGVLELHSKSPERARAAFEASAGLAAGLPEPLFNLALLSLRQGNCQESHRYALRARSAAGPGGSDAAELLEQLGKYFGGA